MTIRSVQSTFEREPLISPFGFKGGYLTELWQSVVMLESASGRRAVGLGTQSVLWSDASVFAAHTESGGNALMVAVTEFALQAAVQTQFESPHDLLDTILPEAYEFAKRITRRPDLRMTFVLNALVPIDNAAWSLFAAENDSVGFDGLIPEKYRPALGRRHRRVAAVQTVGYGTGDAAMQRIADDGHFIVKVKLGGPGNRDEMLAHDRRRLSAVHRVFEGFEISGGNETPQPDSGGIEKSQAASRRIDSSRPASRRTDTPQSAMEVIRTPQSASGGIEPPQPASAHILYYLDLNGRYHETEDVRQLLDDADRIGAMDRILVLEEPFPEGFDADVSDLGVRVAADESAHTDEDARRLIELGYGAIALKPVAKTLSMTLRIAAVAHDQGVPCFCADLTVNPILVDWNKVVAARLDPLPGLDCGLLETNGHQNYENWDRMMGYHPCAGAPWTHVKDGCFELSDGFYEQDGGIFETSPHYLDLVRPEIQQSE